MIGCYSVQFAVGTIDWPGTSSVLWSLEELEGNRTEQCKLQVVTLSRFQLECDTAGSLNYFLECVFINK